MAVRYEELWRRLSGYGEEAATFETKALNKYREMLSTLKAELDAPDDVIQMVELPAQGEERPAPLNTVLSETGLHFCFRIVFPSGHHFEYQQKIAPVGNQLAAEIGKNGQAIEVTSESGTRDWVEWVAGDLEAQLRKTALAKLSSKLKQS